MLPPQKMSTIKFSLLKLQINTNIVAMLRTKNTILGVEYFLKMNLCTNDLQRWCVDPVSVLCVNSVHQLYRWKEITLDPLV